MHSLTLDLITSTVITLEILFAAFWFFWIRADLARLTDVFRLAINRSGR